MPLPGHFSAEIYTMLAASVLAGLLWDRIGPSATFIVGGGFAAITALLLILRKIRSALRTVDR